MTRPWPACTVLPPSWSFCLCAVNPDSSLLFPKCSGSVSWPSADTWGNARGWWVSCHCVGSLQHKQCSCSSVLNFPRTSIWDVRTALLLWLGRRDLPGWLECVPSWAAAAAAWCRTSSRSRWMRGWGWGAGGNGRRETRVLPGRQGLGYWKRGVSLGSRGRCVGKQSWKEG